VPRLLHEQGLDELICMKLQLLTRPADLKRWDNLVYAVEHPRFTVRIGMCGKYTDLSDSYKSLIEALRQVRDDLDFLELVHRLDRDTSGCLLLAKSRTALLALNESLKQHRMDKRYLALVAGRWPARRDFVSARLERFEAGNGERRVRVDASGKMARTRFAVRETFDRLTLIEAEPVTGRTHQIRVHAHHAGHPLLGDDKYGSREGARLATGLGLSRLFLHAEALTFPEPTSGRPVQIKAPLPDDLATALVRARQAS
jgi:23S rRNA pseudouridine955/2504/2580 synthase